MNKLSSRLPNAGRISSTTFNPAASRATRIFGPASISSSPSYRRHYIYCNHQQQQHKFGYNDSQKSLSTSGTAVPHLRRLSSQVLRRQTIQIPARQVQIRSKNTMSAATRMAERLHGKTILITGASSGIGRSTALEFARTSPQSLRLILTARREDALKQLAEEIHKEVGTGVQVLPCKLDMSDASAVERFVETLPSEWRGINCLVNNAGMVKGDERSPEIALTDIQEMINTNVIGLITMTQAVMKLFREHGAPGSNGQGDVINVGSIAGREGYPGGSIYCATKAAVRTFTDALRKEQIHSLVRVMEIDPGRVETNFSVVRFRGDKTKADAVYANTEPLTPDDIAEIIVFMAGRRENVVLADTMVYPQHQGSATHVHRNA